MTFRTKWFWSDSQKLLDAGAGAWNLSTGSRAFLYK